MTLTREQILASRAERKPVPLEVPEWGGEVFVRVLSAKDQMELSEGIKPTEMPVKVIIHCLVDEAGEPIFADEDFETLAAEEFPIIMRIFAVVAKLNGLSTRELEEAVETFTSAPDESSSSG